MRRVFVVLFVTLIWACACGATNGTAPSPPSLTTFSLSGRVMENGSPSTPISGATIAIGDGPDAGRSATSDAAGNYRLTGLQTSGFTATASAEDHTPQSLGVTLVGDRTLSFLLNRNKSLVEPTRFDLRGTAIDDEGKPMANAVVYLDFMSTDVPGAYLSHATGITDGSGSYRIWFDAIPGLMAHRATGFGCLRPSDSNTYAGDCQWITASSKDIIQDFHPYKLLRLIAGQSSTVTVLPGDSVCLNNVQDFPGIEPDYVCRTVRIVATTDGVVRVEALSLDGGNRPPLEVEVARGDGPCCRERMENPTSLAVTARTELVANIEMFWGAATARRFEVRTTWVNQ